MGLFSKLSSNATLINEGNWLFYGNPIEGKLPDYKKAFEKFNTVLQRSGEGWFLSLMMVGVCLEKMGNYQSALSIYGKIIDGSPESILSLIAIGASARDIIGGLNLSLRNDLIYSSLQIKNFLYLGDELEDINRDLGNPENIVKIDHLLRNNFLNKDENVVNRLNALKITTLFLNGN